MILFTGDLFLGNDPFNIDDAVKRLFSESNHIVSNLEGVLYNPSATKRKDKASILTFDEKSFDHFLEQVHSKILFTMGNNHIHDLGEVGIFDTLHLLSKHANINSIGVGLLEDVYKPKVITDGEKRIAILPVSTDDPEVMSILATSSNHGVLNLNDCRIPKIIAAAKNNADYFVIIPHWGMEYIGYPSVQLRKKAYEWIDAGADLVIGHHPHVIQGKEQYNGKWVYYSLGNFLFNNFYNKHGVFKKWKAENNRSVALTISFDRGISIKENGLMLDNKKRKLCLSDDSQLSLLDRSVPLVKDDLEIKYYYSFWQREYYKLLKKERSIKIRLTKLFSKHRNHSRLGYLFIRLHKKTINRLRFKT